MVPPWLMPIQKTNVVMYNPHMLGRRFPVTPKPIAT
jgi:hypothetical protein